MAASLIDTLTGDFDPSQYKDGYREALQAVIDAKIAGREVVTPDEPDSSGGAVLDLMAALRASVDAAKGKKGPVAVEESEDGDDAPAAAPKKRPPAKRAAAKKAAPAKAPAKAARKRKTA